MEKYWILSLTNLSTQCKMYREFLRLQSHNRCCVTPDHSTNCWQTESWGGRKEREKQRERVGETDHSAISDEPAACCYAD